MSRNNGCGESSGTSGINRDKNFCSKPARGWSHPDNVIMNEGVAFNVRYVGCLEVKTSMKLLNFNTRSQVAKECISRVCESAGLKTYKKRRIDKRIVQAISEKPLMENAGTNVTLTVSNKGLTLVSIESGELIAQHEMPRISFASGGDTDTLDFVAYVAKNVLEFRACYVLECGGGQAQDLIAAIGQAFELRYNEFFNKTPSTSDKDYYNDLPGKVPPDLLCDTKLSNSLPLLDIKVSMNIKTPRKRLSSNLIDLNSPPADHKYVNEKMLDACLNNNSNHNNNNNSNNENSSSNTTSNSVVRDVFDMHSASLSSEIQRSQLITESWFHGIITRQQAENLLKEDGDFLVRESQGTPGQYVLTGLQASPKHLLLMDPEGYVRTKDRLFESISHLINYHWTNALPIVSAESALILKNPINKNKSGAVAVAHQSSALNLSASQQQQQQQQPWN